MAFRICGEEENRLIAGPDSSAPHSTKPRPRATLALRAPPGSDMGTRVAQACAAAWQLVSALAIG